MADNPVTVNVNGFGQRRSILFTVLGLVAVGYLAALGWTKYGPVRPTLDASFARTSRYPLFVQRIAGFRRFA